MTRKNRTRMSKGERRQVGSTGTKKRAQRAKFKSGATYNKRNRTDRNDRGTLAP